MSGWTLHSGKWKSGVSRAGNIYSVGQHALDSVQLTEVSGARVAGYMNAVPVGYSETAVEVVRTGERRLVGVYGCCVIRPNCQSFITCTEMET